MNTYINTLVDWYTFHFIPFFESVNHLLNCVNVTKPGSVLNVEQLYQRSLSYVCEPWVIIICILNRFEKLKSPKLLIWLKHSQASSL